MYEWVLQNPILLYHGLYVAFQTFVQLHEILVKQIFWRLEKLLPDYRFVYKSYPRLALRQSMDKNRYRKLFIDLITISI